MRRKTTKQFIEEAKKLHGDKYDYSKVEYIDARNKVCIICPIHGEFWQTPDNHLHGQNCPKCIGRLITCKDEFKEIAKNIHGNKYDYSKVKYIDTKTKVCVICPKHGEFLVNPNHHISQKQGCPKCAGKYKTTEEVIETFKSVHGDKYDYSKVNYKTMKDKVVITCPIHGDFEQSPDNHIHGKGCPSCNESQLEKYIRNILEENKIDYVYQKRFSWLGKQSLDFYLPKYNIAIECQGIQHYEAIDFAGKGKEWANKLFENTKKRDNIKLSKIKENGIKMLYINEENKNNFLNKIKYGANNSICRKMQKRKV